MKIALMALTFMSGYQLWAQDNSKTLLQTEIMAQKLGLDEQQKAALDKELKAAKEERRANMEKMRALREEMRRDAFVERQAQAERLKEILTEEQWTKLQKQKQIAIEKGKRFRKEGQQNKRTDIGERRAKARKLMMKRRLDKGNRPQNDKEKGGN